MKRASLVLSILIPVGITLAVGVTLASVLISWRSAKIADDLTSQIVEEAVSHYAYQIKADGEKAYTFATTSAPLVYRLRTHSFGRDAVIEAFREIIESNEDIMGIWTVWEPNKFDNMDNKYRNRSYHDESGRFIPYVYTVNGEIHVEALVDYDSQTAGHYYYGAKSSGQPFFTDPYSYESGNGEIVVYSIAVPIVENGEVIGAVGVDLDVNRMNEIYNNVTIMNAGRIFVSNSNGITVTHPNPERLYKHYSESWEAPVSNPTQEIIANGGSLQDRTYSQTFDTETFVHYQGVKIGNDDKYWVVCGAVSLAAARASSRHLTFVTLVFNFAVAITIGVIIVLLVRKLLRSLNTLTRAAQQLAQGKVDHVYLEDVYLGETKNEATLLKQAFYDMVHNIRRQVEIVQQIAEGDLSVKVQPRSYEDLLNVALEELLMADNQVFNQIKQSADVVTAGSMQISDSAQMQAQAIIQQSSAMEELESSVTEIASRASENESMAVSAAGFSESIRTIANRSAGKIDMASRSAVEVNKTSENIYSVISISDNIAFDINNLAMDIAAAVSRYGSDNKELGELAEKARNISAKGNESARDTALIITDAIKRTEMAMRVSAETAGILGEIIADVNQNSDLVNQIAEYSRAQTASIRQIELGIREISQATQRNSAAAEESASTSEELSSQAELLRHMVSQFKLSDQKFDYPGMINSEEGVAFSDDGDPDNKYKLGEDVIQKY